MWLLTIGIKIFFHQHLKVLLRGKYFQMTVRTSENLVLQKYNENTCKKWSKSLYSELQRLTESLQQSEEYLLKKTKKQLKIHKNSKICSVLTCSITISSPQLQVILKTYSLTIRVAVKTRSLAFTGMSSGELPQKPHSQGIVIIQFVWQLTGKSSLAELVFL